jgi:spermidine synthase
VTRLTWILEGAAAALVLLLLGLRVVTRRRAGRARIAERRGRAVVREAGGQRELWLDDGARATLQSRVAAGDPLISGVAYTDGFHLYAPAAGRVLCIGAGAAIVPRQLIAFHPELAVHVVDCDADVLAVARAWFGLVEGDRLTVELADGRAVLERPGAWDLVIVDAFGAGDFPAHLATVELFALARTRLAPGGALAVNLAGTLDGAVLRGVLAGLVEAFGAERTAAFGVPGPHGGDYATTSAGNTVAFAFRDGVPPAPRRPPAARARLPALAAIGALRLAQLPAGTPHHDGAIPAAFPIR